jgi:phage-related minor tail protein
VNAQVSAALRSTGGVAGETAQSIDALAKAELRKTGIDDEVVKGAEAMLLRFTQVRDVAGQGNDIFGRATKTALDLSVALGRDATDAAFALGKALNDPTRGVQQLRRVGAAFTVEEAKQIKQLAEHGHVLQAQKAILDALTKSYGGTAEAVAKVEPWKRLRETLKNLSADAIKPLLPDFQRVSDRVDAGRPAREQPGRTAAAEDRRRGTARVVEGLRRRCEQGRWRDRRLAERARARARRQGRGDRLRPGRRASAR